MSMTDPLRIGMLGYRFMGRAHANAIDRLPMFFPDAPETERTVLIGRDEQAVREAADRFGFAQTSTNWEEVFDMIDVFYNLGPNFLHADPSIAALEAGVHVFCEKPMARTLEEADRMQMAAASATATTAIGFNYRFSPAIQYAKHLIADDVLGEIYHVRARYLQDWLVDPDTEWSWRNDKELAGSGALGDLGSHILDLTRFLLTPATGAITGVSGQLQTFTEQRPSPADDGPRAVTVDDAFTAHGRFENGATATFEATRNATGSKNALTIEINGSLGSLRFDLERLNELQLLEQGNRAYETILVTDASDPYVDAWWPPGHVLGWEHTFVHENYEFLSAIANDEPHTPSFDAGQRVQELLDAIEQSANEQRWITTGPTGK